MSRRWMSVRSYLDQVGRLAPEDDRIWLGRANLAFRVGSYDEAARWIDVCLESRPDDRIRLAGSAGLGDANNRLAEARTALKHLPADGDPAEVHRLSAWLASACGDLECERRELASLVAEAPEDFAALERLENVGAAGVGDDGRRRTATPEDGDRTRPARYRELYRRNQPARCRGDGPTGRTAGPSLRGDRLPHRRDRRGTGPRRPAGGPPSPRGGRTRPDEAGRTLFDRLPTDCGGRAAGVGIASVRH